MANPTTNYGFVLPTSTDLVTDLPADFDVALQGVDTQLKALNPETTLGDLAYGSATANTNTRLPIGTTGQILTVVGGVPAWSSESGDISAVTAGTGLTGGGTSGAVTLSFDYAVGNQAIENAQTGTTYTLVAADSGKLVTTSNASAVVVTIPAGVFAAGEQINIQSIGVGLTTISGGAVTITSTGASASAPILRARYSAATIICTASNVFTVIGDLS